MVPKNSKESGFSLITIAIALAIIGLLMVPAIHLYNLQLKAERVARNDTSSSLASGALNRYFLLHGRYPIPSTPGNAQGTVAFGRSAVMPGTGWPSCQNGATSDLVVCSTILNTLNGNPVLIGVVPFAELNIPFSSVIDANKNLLTYAITQSLTTSATYSENGGEIVVMNSANNPIYNSGSRSHFVVVGHGDDSLGAYGLNGLRNRGCSNDANSDDFENCNKDGRFRSNVIPGSARIQINDGNGTVHFDDYLKEMKSSVSGIWSFLPDPLTTTNLSINDRVGGNVATGDCDGRVPCTPVSRLDIYGDGNTAVIPAVRANSIRTSRICGRGSSTPGSGGWGCINDHALFQNIPGFDQNSCTWVGGVFCPPAASTWSNANLPPIITPQLIGGVPPVLPEAGSYWMSTPTNGPFHRGNGILCVGNRGMNGILNRDEVCNDTSWVNNATSATLGGCPAGEYARGIQASGALFCQLPMNNN